jgi:hypothetical protein
VGAAILQCTDALLRKRVIHHDIAATEQGIIFYFFHDAVKGVIIAMYIRYDQQYHFKTSIFEGEGVRCQIAEDSGKRH